MANRRKRNRISLGLAVVAVTAVAAGVGIGTADAGTRKPWAKPRPSASAAKPSPSVTPSKTASATPSKTASATPSKTASVTPSKTASVTPSKTASAAPATSASWTPPPANASFDYQIGQAYTPPAGVTVVSRDHTASPAKGLYNICYVNAFQAQPDAEAWWQANHPEVLLRDKDGELVIDEDWDEILLDFSTAAKRATLTSVVGGWMADCAAKGFQAVEPDNLDSYDRSGGLLTKSQAIAYAASLTSYAHGKGLAVGQKNTADLSPAQAKQAGFDFAVAEECADWDECENYTANYGHNVLVIEYTQSQFTKACQQFGSTLSIVLRDVDVTAPGSKSYVFKSC